jgi:16S rRNA (cytosine967-C5)-methyltransferase
MMRTAREGALLALRSIQKGAFADGAVDKVLPQVEAIDRRLVTELVYGCIRRQRSLDALLAQLAPKGVPPDLRLILHLGLYQLRYLNQIPASAAVDTTVELAKCNGFKGLAGLTNGILRQYLRCAETGDPLVLPDEPVSRLGMLQSYPDWIVAVWLEQFGLAATEALCEWFNRSPHIDLRVNPLRTTIDQVEAAMQSAGVAVERVPPFPQALRLPPSPGAIHNLPGFREGWWTVQDCSAQLVGHLLDPQPGETVVDACAAPGGKTTHIAELMQDQGVVWGCDRHASRLRKLQENGDRLHLSSIRIRAEDSRTTEFVADRVLLDAPCSGLGTLHRHADARWRQTPESVQELAQLQSDLLMQAASWVKPGGTLVYATCTLHPAENEAVIAQFLDHSPQWQIAPPDGFADWVSDRGWLQVLPHQHNMDGFFMARLKRSDRK